MPQKPILPVIAVPSPAVPGTCCMLGADQVLRLQVARQLWPLSPLGDPGIPFPRTKGFCEVPVGILL